jgi:hypothetical protein
VLANSVSITQRGVLTVQVIEAVLGQNARPLGPTNRLQDVLCSGSGHCGPAWWVVCGGWELEAPGYLIGRQAQRLWKQ